MPYARNDDVDTIDVKAVEGGAVYGGSLLVKALMQGNNMTLLEARYEPGVGAPEHTHTHETIVYVVRGRMRTMIDGKEYILDPGDACRHPTGVRHTVEAIEPSLVVEIKSPAPTLATMIATDNN
jgi:quercetin dioxygenase-like cupin family protein